MPTRSDNFNRANETPIGSPWVSSVGGGALLVSNALTSTASTDRQSYYNDTWGSNQESFATVGNLSVRTNYAQLGVRMDSSGNALVLITDGTSGADGTEFGRLTSGSYTALGGISTTFSNGDRMRLTVSGASGSIILRAFKDTGSGWSLVGELTGVTGPSSGAPGAGAYGLATIDDWTGTDGATGGGWIGLVANQD